MTAFELIDKPCLQTLPTQKYEYPEWKETKVQFNYHVDYDGSFYCVHYSYINQPCSERATARGIEIYIGNECVAAYPWNYNIFRGKRLCLNICMKAKGQYLTRTLIGSLHGMKRAVLPPMSL